MEKVTKDTCRIPNWYVKYDQFKDECEGKNKLKQLEGKPPRRAYDFPSTLEDSLRLIMATIDADEQSEQAGRAAAKCKLSAKPAIPDSKSALADKANDKGGLASPGSTLGKRKRGICPTQRRRPPPLAAEVCNLELGTEKPRRSSRKRVKPDYATIHSGMPIPAKEADDKEESPKRPKSHSFEGEGHITLPKLVTIFHPAGQANNKMWICTRPIARESGRNYDAGKDVTSNFD